MAFSHYIFSEKASAAEKRKEATDDQGHFKATKNALN